MIHNSNEINLILGRTVTFGVQNNKFTRQFGKKFDAIFKRNPFLLGYCSCDQTF